jgi:hypothetical protein
MMTMKCDLVKNYDGFHKIISILKLKMIKYNLLFIAFSRYAIHNSLAGFFRLHRTER